MSEMEQYIRKSTGDKILIIGAGLLFSVVGGFVVIKQGELFGWIAVVIGVLVLYGGLTAGSTDQKALQKLEDEGSLSRAEVDFLTAVPVADDRARVGKEFIFRSKDCYVLRCCDVVKFEYRESLSESGEHTVMVGAVYLTMENGKTEKLFECAAGDAVEASAYAAEILLERNPNIEVINHESGGLIDGAVKLVQKLKNKNE